MNYLTTNPQGVSPFRAIQHIVSIGYIANVDILIP
jgi:hypothetical protein